MPTVSAGAERPRTAEEACGESSDLVVSAECLVEECRVTLEGGRVADGERLVEYIGCGAARRKGGADSVAVEGVGHPCSVAGD